jgi:hypothetical protein
VRALPTIPFRLFFLPFDPILLERGWPGALLLDMHLNLRSLVDALLDLAVRSIPSLPHLWLSAVRVWVCRQCADALAVTKHPLQCIDFGRTWINDRDFALIHQARVRLN